MRLQPVTSPAAAQAGVTTVSVTGSNFPTGTITAGGSSVTVACAAGSATAAASRVLSLAGSTKRVYFTVPASLAPASPQTCQVSISGAASGGTSFASTNSASLALNPAAMVSLSPAEGTAGATLTVAFTGTYTSFVQGSTAASFGSGIQVAGADDGAFGPLTVTGDTSASASITIDSSAAPGLYTLTIATGIQTATASFTVNPPANSAPTAVINGPYSGTAGQAVSFSAAGSTDSDGDTLTDFWSFGDGAQGSGPSPSHTYATGGDYTVTLTVDDGHGNQISATATAVIADMAPAANAGPPQTSAVGVSVLLDGSGSTGNNLSYQWSFLSLPSGSLAQLQNPSSVHASFTPDVFGAYQVQLKATDTATSAFSTATVLISGNTPPVAKIVVNPVASPNTKVVLDGSQSNDPDGDTLTFGWQITGPGNPTLDSTDPVHPSFVVPQTGAYAVTLTVTDTDNLSSQTQVTISSQAPPVAKPAADVQVVAPPTLVQLDGADSTDPNGLSITGYAWSLTLPPGSSAQLQNATTAQPAFTADIAGTYVAQLVVTDSAGLVSLPQTVEITSEPRPIALPGAEQLVTPGVAVHLDGSGSTSPSGHVPLTYQWSFTFVPPGSSITNASLTGATSAQPAFTPDWNGTYTLQLIVTDSLGLASLPATVNVTQNTRPVAKATAMPAVITPGTLVQLDGSGSTDADSDSLTYQWTLTTPAASTTARLSSATAIAPTFTSDVTGTYTAQLTVTDSFGLSDSATVTVGSEQPPVANAGSPQAVPVGATVTLDGSKSRDPQDESLSYAWSFTQWPNSGSQPAPALIGPAAVNPTFTASQQGLYIAQLVVTNADGLKSAPSTVTINGDAAPTANAGAAQSVSPGATVHLDGTGSTDPNGLSLTFQWSVLSWPPANTPPAPALSDPASSSPTFIAAVAGQVQLQLIVSDGVLSSTPQTVLITAAYPAPVAGIVVTPGNNVTVNTPVSLDGSRSTGNGLSSTWAFVLPLPAGSAATITNATSSQASFTPDVAGSYTVQLTVTDSSSQTSTAQVTITAAAPALTLTLASPLVAGNRVDEATVTAPAAAPAGGLVVNIASSVAGVVTAPASVTVPAGQTSVQFAVTGAAPGNTSLTASAPGYSDSAPAAVTVSGSVISLANNLVLAPGQTSSIALSLSAPAPAGALTITLTSDQTGIATVVGTATVPAGSETPAANPQVTGVNIGTAYITASAPGYAPDTEPVQVTLAAALSPGTVSLPASNSTSVTISLSSGANPAVAPAGGVTFTLATDSVAIATVPSSVTILQGQVSATFTLNGIAQGTTLLRADAPGISEATATVHVGAAPAINVGGSAILGQSLQSNTEFYLSAAPPAGTASVPVTVAVNSGGTNCNGCLL
ncbi:MAG: PKD domain-containing protein, partial [Terriglobales bacterium]